MASQELPEYSGMGSVICCSTADAFRRASKAICVRAATTAHASGSEARSCARWFPDAHRTGPRKCRRGTSRNISCYWAGTPRVSWPITCLFPQEGEKMNKPLEQWNRETISALAGRLRKLFTPHPRYQRSTSKWDTGILFRASARAQHLLKQVQLSALAELMLWGLLQLEGFSLLHPTASSSSAALLSPQQDTCILPTCHRGDQAALCWENASATSQIFTCMLPFSRRTCPC